MSLDSSLSPSDRHLFQPETFNMSPPTANPTTGKTHVAEKTKFHEGTLKPYSHEELGTADDVRDAILSMKWIPLMFVSAIELRLPLNELLL